MKSFFCTFGESSPTSLAIGKFDGMHRAHQELFARLDERGAILIVDANRGNLTPSHYKKEFTTLPIYAIPLEQIKDLSGEAFVELLKEHFPALQRLVVGYDFRFGKNRAFGVKELADYFKGEVVVVSEIFYQGYSVHSEAIRELITQGEVALAGALLGRDYFIEGEIVKGQGLGARELVPTINLAIERFLIPRTGVYVSQTQLKGERFDSISFVGNRLSSDGKFAIETHLLGANEAMIPPASRARIYFKRYLRENRRFERLEELKAQIAQDIKDAQRIHALRSEA